MPECLKASGIVLFCICHAILSEKNITFAHMTEQEIHHEADKILKGRVFTPGNITSLGEDDVFVFGSNLAGHHAGGAARTARRLFGAEWGEGDGWHGQSYAIPTMQGGVDSIRPYVDRFIDIADECDQNTFWVTRIGCGIAGLTDEEIAPLFDRAFDLYNVRLPESFARIIVENRLRKQHNQQ